MALQLKINGLYERIETQRIEIERLRDVLAATTPADRACRAVVEFMKDWNSMPPEDCAWRMFHRLKTELADIERESVSSNEY